MKKILVYCQQFYPLNTGYSNACVNFWTEISKDTSFQISIITPTLLNNSPELKDNLRILRVPKLFGRVPILRHFINEFYMAYLINKIWNIEEYEFYFNETLDNAIVLSLLKRELLSKAIIRIHSTSDTEHTVFLNNPHLILNYWLIRNIISNKVKNIAATSRFHLDFYQKYYLNGNLINKAKNRFFVLPNIICSSNSHINQKNNLKNKLDFLFVGRLDYLGNNQKGFDDVVDALKIINLEVKRVIKIHIVGKGFCTNILLKQINDAGVDFEYYEELTSTQMKEKIDFVDICLLPSRYEGLSMFALECLAAGKVMLLSDAGPLSDLVDGNGFTFQSQNIFDLAEKLTKLSRLDLNQKILMSNKSKEIFKEKYSSEIIKNNFKLLSDICIA